MALPAAQLTPPIIAAGEGRRAALADTIVAMAAPPSPAVRPAAAPSPPPMAQASGMKVSGAPGANANGSPTTVPTMRPVAVAAAVVLRLHQVKRRRMSDVIVTMLAGIACRQSCSPKPTLATEVHAPQ